MKNIQPPRRSVNSLRPSKELYSMARKQYEMMKLLLSTTPSNCCDRVVTVEGKGFAKISLFRDGDNVIGDIKFTPIESVSSSSHSFLKRVRIGSPYYLNTILTTKVGNYTDPKDSLPIPYMIDRVNKLPPSLIADYNKLEQIMFPNIGGMTRAHLYRQTWLSSGGDMCVSWNDTHLQILDDPPINYASTIASKIHAAMFTNNKLMIVFQSGRGVELGVFNKDGTRSHYYERDEFGHLKRDEDGNLIDLGIIPYQLLGSRVEFALFKSSGKGLYLLFARQVGPNRYRSPKMELKEIQFAKNDDLNINYSIITLWDFENPYITNDLSNKYGFADMPIHINEWRDVLSMTKMNRLSPSGPSMADVVTFTYNPLEPLSPTYNEVISSEVSVNSQSVHIEDRRYPQYSLPLSFKDDKKSVFVITYARVGGDIDIFLIGDITKSVTINRFDSSKAFYQQILFDGSHVLFSLIHRDGFYPYATKSVTYIIDPYTLVYDYITPRIDLGNEDWDRMFAFQLIPDGVKTK